MKFSLHFSWNSIFIIIEQLTNEVQVFVRKEKCMGLLSTLIFELNQMNSDKIVDGRIGFEVKLSILWKYLDKKIEILKECHCYFKYTILYFKYLQPNYWDVFEINFWITEENYDYEVNMLFEIDTVGQLWAIYTKKPFFTNVTHSVARVRLKYHRNTYKGSRPVVFCKKSVLKDFAKVIGKHLRQSVFFDKVAGLRHSSESKSSALTR